jgi:hypothetical protein
MTDTHARSPSKISVVVGRSHAIELVRGSAKRARQDRQPFLAMHLDSVADDAQQVASYRELLSRAQVLFEHGPQEEVATLLKEIEAALKISPPAGPHAS